jgi:hypothetical protein
MGNLLNYKLIYEDDENNETNIIDFAYIERSIIKLQSLGVLQCDFRNVPGTLSVNNIDRFPVTFFGQKLLEYINI